MLDYQPAERSYVWMGEGMVDRKPEKIPDLAPLIEDSAQEVYKNRLQNFTKQSGFSLVNKLIVDTGGKYLRLYWPRRVDLRNKTGPLLEVWDVPPPRLLVSNDIELYRRQALQLGVKLSPAQQVVTEEELCLAWGHGVEELEKLAQALERLGYIKNADTWCQYFRTNEDSPLKQTSALPIEWLKYKKLIHQVLSSPGTKLKEEDWRIHFGISGPDGSENEDEDLAKIIKQAMRQAISQAMKSELSTPLSIKYLIFIHYSQFQTGNAIGNITGNVLPNQLPTAPHLLCLS